MGYEYQIRYASPDPAGAADILRRLPTAVERPDGFDFRSQADAAAWPDATASVDADGIVFCDYRGGEGWRVLGELVAHLASYGPVIIEEL
jgi:hypothetical protein